MIGTTVGKYRIVARLGRGGMGTVYKAIDETLDRDVAIKVLNSEVRDARLMARFRAEATTLARLNHPGIATIYEVHKTEFDLLMVMELVRGETLDQMLVRTGPLPPERAARIVAQVLGALGYAHRAGIIHRDLKPANVMLTEAGVVKIMDFGIARVVGAEHLTSDGTTMGTPAYMAPEQVIGKDIDPRADLYSAGVVFYRLLTGCLPFSADTPFAMVQKQLWDPPTPARSYRNDLPDWAEQILDRALAKSPGDRFQTAEEFRTALLSPLGGSASALTIEASGLMAADAWLPSPVTPLPVTPPTGVSAAELTLAPTVTAMTTPTPADLAATLAAAAPTAPLAPAALPCPPRTRVAPRTLAMAGAGVAVLLIGLLVAMRFGAPGGGPLGSNMAASAATSQPAAATGGLVMDATAPGVVATDVSAAGVGVVPGGGATAVAVATGGIAAPVAPARVGVRTAVTAAQPTPPPIEPPAVDATTAAAPSGREVPAPPEAPAAPLLPPFRFGAQTIVVDGGKHRQRDSTVELADGAVSVVGKDSAFSTVVPMAGIVGFTYSHSKQPLWNTPQGPAEIAHLDGGAFGFLKGDQDWVSLRTDGMSLVLRVREQDARKVIAALEERIGRKVERVERR